jgi:hypothetical protein
LQLRFAPLAPPQVTGADGRPRSPGAQTRRVRCAARLTPLLLHVWGKRARHRAAFFLDVPSPDPVYSSPRVCFSLAAACMHHHGLQPAVHGMRAHLPVRSWCWAPNGRGPARAALHAQGCHHPRVARGQQVALHARQAACSAAAGRCGVPPWPLLPGRQLTCSA